MANISFNPSLMTGTQNSFLLQTQGYVQGLTQDDPVSRMFLSAGIVGSGVTQPVWGGMAIAANVGGAATNGNGVPNITLTVATTTQINGFTVFDQAISMIQTPGNTVPVAVAGQSAAFYTFGSNARIPLPVASAAFTALSTDPLNVTLYWDTSALNITVTSNANTIALPSTVQVLAVDSNSKGVSYNAGTGVVSWLQGQNMALIKI